MSDIKKCPRLEVAVKGGSMGFDPEIVYEITKFTILWGIFEKEKCGNYCRSDELPKIAKNIQITNPNKLGIFAALLQKRAAALEVNVNDYVDRLLYPPKATSRIGIAEVKRFINSGGQEPFVGALYAICRIRNNIFHGLKDFTVINNQVELFEVVSSILMEIIEN